MTSLNKLFTRINWFALLFLVLVRSVSGTERTSENKKSSVKEDQGRFLRKNTERRMQKIPTPPDGSAKWNVLMIAVDDLNDWVGVLGGHPSAKTPNIDNLARSSTTFRHAYAPSSACLPTRTALMCGIRPTTSGIYTNGVDWHSVVGDRTSIPKHFKDNGWESIGVGKLFHGVGRDDPGYDNINWDTYIDPTDANFKLQSEPDCPKKDNSLPPPGCWSSTDICDRGLDWGRVRTCEYKQDDYQRASWLIERLHEERKKPFFMGIGFKKPHLDWKVPAKYYDLFPLSEIELPSIKEDDLNDVPPIGVDLVQLNRKGGSHHDVIVNARMWESAVQGYLSSIAYGDDMIGRVITALDESKYRDNTIVVLWSDHGFHLGEKQHWKKFTMWEDSTHIPFMIRVPGVTDQKPGGEVCDHPVDLMSIYPTLNDLVGLPPPAMPTGKPPMEGYSVLDLLHSPNAPWDKPALMAFEQHNAVRKKQYRYIRYTDASEELYDNEKDEHEWDNLAFRPDASAEKIIKDLRRELPVNQAEAIPMS